jgi:glycerol-3-phosphate dehydrogenase
MELDSQVHPADFVIKPRVGEFLVFDKQETKRAISHVIYQAEESDEGGALIAPTVEGNLVAGPTSRDVRDFQSTATTQKGLDHVWRVAQKIIPDLKKDDIIANFAGVRTNIVNVDKEKKDFVVRVSAAHFVSALGIKNPGMTSSPVLAARALELLVQEGLVLEANPAFSPLRKAHTPFLKCRKEEQDNLIQKDPRFGNVICRCESITEGDVACVCARTLAPTTLDGLKRRLRTGMGRCQGAYCTPRALAVLAKELRSAPASLQKGEFGGRVILGQVK